MRTGQRPPDLGAVDKFRIGMGVLWRHQQLANIPQKATLPAQERIPTVPQSPRRGVDGGGPPIHILLANPMGKKVPVAPILE